MLMTPYDAMHGQHIEQLRPMQQFLLLQPKRQFANKERSLLAQM